MTNARTLNKLAGQMRKRIGAHHKMIGDSRWTQEEYLRQQQESDDAVSLAKYLICHLDDRHLAVTFAHAVGMPGYINQR